MNVALYPFNKITQGIVRFRDLTELNVKAVIDFVLHKGEDIGRIMEGVPCGIPVTDDLDEALREVDTLILNDPGTSFGNNQGVYSNFNLKELWRSLVIAAQEKGIRVVSVHEIFDAETLAWMEDNRIRIEVEPQIPETLERRLDEEYAFPAGDEIAAYLNYFSIDDKIAETNLGIDKIAVFATRGCLGKFTAQMTLFRSLRSAGQKVKAIITEPTASTFNQPGGDIMKFLSRRKLGQYPYYIHAAVREAEAEGNDFILLSGQGSLLPNRNFVIAATKIAYLSAFRPDAIFLIVGYDDDEQIRDCIDILRIYGDGRTPFAFLLPDKIETDFGSYIIKSKEEIELRKRELIDKFQAAHVESVLDAERLTGELINRRQARLAEMRDLTEAGGNAG